MKGFLTRFWSWLSGLFQARYEGATHTGDRSWLPATIQSARQDISAATRRELVRKSRYFEKNSAILNRMADLFECYTVGTGLVVSPAASGANWNREAKRWFSVWERYPDLVSRQAMGTLEGLMARTWFIDGEAFILKTRGKSGRPRIQLLEGHLCGTPPDLMHREGIDIIDGIQIDDNGRPVAYYFAEETPRGEKVWGDPKPAEMVIHLFEPSRPGQYRGLPFCYPAINDLHDLDDLQLLEMQAAKDNSAITHVIKNAAGELSPDELRRQRFNKSVTTNTGTTTTEEASSYYRDLVGGRLVVLRKGDDYDQHGGERPSVTTKEYWRYLTEKICAGVGIPYVLVFPDSMQGTVYRGALDMANTFFRARSMVLIEVKRQIYEFVMNWARYQVRELRDAPGDWPAATIQPPRAINVDVGRNSSAMLAELAAGATNYELIYGPLGLDWREMFDKLVEQQRYARSIGLTLSEGAAGGAQDSSGDTPNPDDEPVPAQAGPAGPPRPWFTIRNAAGAGPAEILIYEQIGKDFWSQEGIGAKDFAKALKEVPKSQEITLRINSPGGNVHDGLSIYHLLRDRSEKVTAVVDGVAASIASVIALAGRELQMPRSALYMIHDPWGLVQGTAEDMRRMAEALDKHRDAIAGVYESKTGRSHKEITALMSQETWFTGSEAAEAGFADTVLEEEAIAARFDFSAFRRVPEQLRTQNPTATPTGAHPPNDMKLRDRILALLRKAGVQVEDNITDERLFEAYDHLGLTIGAGTLPALAGEFNALRADVDAARPRPATPPPPAPAPAPAPAAPTPADPTARIAQLERQVQAERNQRVTAALDQILAERPHLNRDTWLPRALADESILADLRAMPVPQVGTDPVRPSARIQTVEFMDRVNRIPQGPQRWEHYRHNWEDLRNQAIAEDRRRQLVPMAANTLAAAITTDMLATGAITVLQNRWAPLRAFARDFGTDRYKPRATVQVKIYTDGPTVQENATSFESGNVTAAAVAPGVSQWTSATHITNDQLNSGWRLADALEICLAALADKVMVTATSVITVANFTATPVTAAAVNFGWDELKTLWGQLKKSPMKNILLDGEYFARFLPTNREGFDPNQPAAFGWDGFFLNTNWSGAGANVTGFACNPQAIGAAAGLPLTPPNIPGAILQETVITIPGLGISIANYMWFSTSTRTMWTSYDVMFGVAKADATAGVIIKSA